MSSGAVTRARARNNATGTSSPSRTAARVAATTTITDTIIIIGQTTQSPRGSHTSGIEQQPPLDNATARFLVIVVALIAAPWYLNWRYDTAALLGEKALNTMSFALWLNMPYGSWIMALLCLWFFGLAFNDHLVAIVLLQALFAACRVAYHASASQPEPQPQP